MLPHILDTLLTRLNDGNFANGSNATPLPEPPDFADDATRFDKEKAS